MLHETDLQHHNQAVYACTEGPRLETPAEIRKLRILGADLVGMTLAPEAFLAREKEICYSPFCYLANYADCLLYTSPSPRDLSTSRMPSSA